MDITERVENGITVFVLEGRIDTEGAADMDLALQAAVSEGQHHIVLDMTSVQYICRVEAVVTHRSPHRTGRAQFEHPVLR